MGDLLSRAGSASIRRDGAERVECDGEASTCETSEGGLKAPSEVRFPIEHLMLSTTLRTPDARNKGPTIINKSMGNSKELLVRVWAIRTSDVDGPDRSIRGLRCGSLEKSGNIPVQQIQNGSTVCLRTFGFYS